MLNGVSYQFPLVPADEAIMHNREFCQEWEYHGWRLNVNEMCEEEVQVAYTIPNPARRQAKGRVPPTAPLLKGKKPVVNAVG